MAFTIRGKMEVYGAGRSENEVARVASTALRALSVMNLLRYTITDIRQLASGEGGIADIISLTTNSIILMYQLQRLMATNIALAGALKVAIGVAGGPTVVGTVGGLIIGGAIAGYGMYQYSQSRMPIYRDQELRRLASRSIGIQ